jgi:hypothetical protein
VGQDDGLVRLWNIVDTASKVLVVVGGAGALAGWKTAAWMLVAGVAGAAVGHLAIGLAAYRRTMRGPWPRVAPMPDDDDW